MPGHEIIGEEERAAVNEIFDRGGVFYPSGFEERREHVFLIEAFEKAVADRIKVQHALFVASGTAALKTALFGLGVGKGDEFITQSHTFVATVEAGLELGATPVITEVDETLNMDPDDLRSSITSNTAAIVPVHMYGVSAYMDEILKIAEEHEIPVLEDSAWGMGSSYNDKPLGTIGDVGIYSFNFGKTITTGEGGMIVTDDSAVYQAAKEYSNHGHEDNPDLLPGEDTRTHWGFNYKTHEVAAAIGLAQLKKLDRVIEAQRANKMALRERLRGLGLTYRRRPNPAGESGRTLAIRLDSAEEAGTLEERLSDHGIGTLNLPSAIKWHFAGEWEHIFGTLPHHGGLPLDECWPRSRALLNRTVALPISVKMSDAELDTLAEVVRSI